MSIMPKEIEIPEFEDMSPRKIGHPELVKLYESELTVPKKHKITERLMISLGSEEFEVNPNPKYRHGGTNVYRQLIAADPSWIEQLEVELAYNWKDELHLARKILTFNQK
jgi:hypothetical protein